VVARTTWDKRISVVVGRAVENVASGAVGHGRANAVRAKKTQGAGVPRNGG
jgi:hypothetical protein